MSIMSLHKDLTGRLWHALKNVSLHLLHVIRPGKGTRQGDPARGPGKGTGKGELELITDHLCSS